jgi:DNA (cytosine-5)-methyltransferase 1
MASPSIHARIRRACSGSPISAVDLFCGAGGLTHGLLSAGIPVRAGIDIDVNARLAYEANNPGAKFLPWDVCSKNYTSIQKLFEPGKLTLLAGCAPCTPFSKLTNGMDNHSAYRLLDNFGRFVSGMEPDLVTMENVPELAERGRPVFEKFLQTLRNAGFHEPAWRIVYCPEYGIPQSRRRLVLLASRLGPISIPDGPPRYRYPSQQRTVRQIIGHLPPVASGGVDPDDPLHTAPCLSALNLRRIRATSKDGGTRAGWSQHLVLDCHKRESGRTYGSIYGRMWWDKPAPTMTTLCTGFGNGRFGHPEQDRSITLREAALFQTFPRSYEFWPADQRINRSAISRMIGNAVPPRLARALGEQMLRHAAEHGYRHSASGRHRAVAI